MAAKLPLIAKKNIRDEYTAKIPGLQEKLKEYTGEDYEFISLPDFDVLFQGINQDESYQKESIGTIAYNAYESLVDKIKYILQSNDEEIFKAHFNQVVSARKIVIVIEDMPSGYACCRVKDGVLELVYKTQNYGTNTSYLADELQKELDKAFAATNKGELPLSARLGFKQDFLDKKEKLEEDIAEELEGNKITLVADPAEIWRLAVEEFDKLKKRDQSEIDLESVGRNMGAAIFAYFEGFKSALNYQFKQDEMMIEGFLDLCPKKEVHFKLVPKGSLSKDRSYNDGIFEDDAYVIRATPQTWYTNVSYACDQLEKLL
ncbi:hypothetical protein H072_4135 [Dactylellina haptotyla CBS 200.50]|uniref:Uncharacterized protein n=1 Tax=Dactylellina haptotyla (strain CBS 200.50) TaxID=1284197 RepID=S8C2N6_DACHA|nr:hypothetical protein H072_4135 [Dactylellina haptotyla CBS 200.50]